MNEQFTATDVQFTRLIQFRQVAYDLYLGLLQSRLTSIPSRLKHSGSRIEGCRLAQIRCSSHTPFDWLRTGFDTPSLRSGYSGCYLSDFATAVDLYRLYHSSSATVVKAPWVTCEDSFSDDACTFCNATVVIAAAFFIALFSY